MSASPFAAEFIQFVTGRLAEPALRAIVSQLAERYGFRHAIDVLPITVAALMSPTWAARHIRLHPEATLMLLPGYCDGDDAPLRAAFPQVRIDRGPRDLRRLAEYFGGKSKRDESYGAYDIEIIAEINHAPRLSSADIMALAERYRSSGADRIDVGCSPGETWSGVGDCVKRLCDADFRVSIDTLNPIEAASAVKAGADLVLSVNSSNVEAACDWGCEVVAIPDDIPTLGGLDAVIERLAARGVPLRIDPILEPIGCGFAASLQRYYETRKRYPDAEIMMGIGNLTELTDVDSAGVNVLLLGYCQELGIRSVLTTEVINWARSSVKECDLARRLTAYAVAQGIPPKHLEPSLVALRDPAVASFGSDHFRALAAGIKDHNYRIFAEGGEIHLISAGLYLADRDPFSLFQRLFDPPADELPPREPPTNIDPTHAFYLGFEFAKALTALTLDKEYRQDESLEWGYLTRRERTRRIKLSGSRSNRTAPPTEET